MNKKIALVLLTSSLTLAACGGNNPTPTDVCAPANACSVTVNLSGVSSAEFDVKVGSAAATRQTLTSGQRIPVSAAGTQVTVTPVARTGFKDVAAQSVTVSASNMTPTLSFTYTATGGPDTGTPTTTAVLTIDLVGANSAHITIRDANGNLVGGYNDVVLADLATVTLPRGVYTISSRDENGATYQNGNVRVDLTGGNQTVVLNFNTPIPATAPFGFTEAERIKLTSELVVEQKANGWRDLTQGVSTGEEPFSTRNIYVKGVINPVFRAAAGTKVEILLARTSGTDVPNNDQIQAADRISTGSAGATGYTFRFDSTRLSEYEAVPMWLVARTTAADGTQAVQFQRVITDNRAPQPAQIDVKGIMNPYSNYKANYTGQGGITANWARGDVSFFSTNPSLQDREFGQAPVNSPLANRLPSGFESVRYYLVPEDKIQNPLQDSDESRLARTIREQAELATNYVLDTKNDLDRNLSAAVGSGPVSTLAVKARDGVTYRVYAITRDELGNEAGSPSYVRVRFDNVGPVITGSGLVDNTPLPFPSLLPNYCLSDGAEVRLGATTDVGVGVDPTTVRFTLGDIALTNGMAFDTNRLADGQYTVSFGLITDFLGNPATGATNTPVFIDNTDPTADFNRPSGQGTFQSGSRVTAEAFGKDEGCGVYETRLFWDSNITAAADADTSTIDLGHPVEFARKTMDTPKDFRVTPEELSSKNWTLNAGWDALSLPRLTADPFFAQQPRYLRAIAVDRAGNLGIASTPIVVTPKATNTNLLALGLFDGYRYNEFPNIFSSGFTATPDLINAIQPVGFNGTTLRRNLTLNGLIDNNLTLDARTTGTLNGTGKPNAEQIKSVAAYGRFDAIQWDAIRDYQINPVTGDPTLRSPRVNTNQLQTERTAILQWRSPWVKLSEAAPAGNQLHTVTSDLLNNFYHDRTFPNKGDTPLLSYDEFNGIVSDTSGSYVFFGEKVQR